MTGPKTGPKVPPPNPLLAATGSYIDRGDTEPEAGQQVTGQLAAWEKWALGGPPGDYASHAILALIADLRASRAREADLDQQMWAAIAERDEQMRLVDGLQQRIDKALADHWQTTERYDGQMVPACGRCSHGDGVAWRWPCPTVAALTGTDSDPTR